MQPSLPHKLAGATTAGSKHCQTPHRLSPLPLSNAKGPARQCWPNKAAATEAGSSHSNGSNPLDPEELTEIIRMVNQSDLVELELKSKRFTLALRKKEALEPPEPVYQAPPPQQAASAPAPAPSASPPSQSAAAPPTPAPAVPSSPPPPAKVEGVEVSSPMSGTFYRSPSPGEPAFVKVGDKVTKGQTICIVEAMKLMNEIEAETTGEIVAIPAENGKPVTPGQALMIIKP